MLRLTLGKSFSAIVAFFATASVPDDNLFLGSCTFLVGTFVVALLRKQSASPELAELEIAIAGLTRSVEATERILLTAKWDDPIIDAGAYSSQELLPRIEWGDSVPLMPEVQTGDENVRHLQKVQSSVPNFRPLNQTERDELSRRAPLVSRTPPVVSEPIRHTRSDRRPNLLRQQTKEMYRIGRPAIGPR